MNTKENFIISINRELGSGGRTVGALLAQSLGVPYYDKVVIKSLEKKYNLDLEQIEKLKSQKKSWWDDFAFKVKPFYDAGDGGFSSMRMVQDADLYETVTPESVFLAESEILRGIADTGPCVIAGRSAFWVLKDYPNHLKVLVLAPLQSRIDRLVRKQNLSREEALKLIEKIDKDRETYVHRFTGTSRYDARAYDLVINMSGHTEESARDLILKYIGL